MSGLAASPLALAPMDLIVPTDRGLYCPAGDFHVDPWRSVGRALITHAHSDHARPGSDLYVCHRDTAPILRRRLGDVAIETVDYGAKLARDGVEVSFHPAGHVLGSAQIRMAHRGEVWVAAGDYKLENDGVATAFEPQRCNVFITESTFGLPIYHWRAQAENYAAIDAWWRDNAAAGRASVLYAYALGKAQRVIAHVDASIGPIVCHGAVEPINALTRQAGIALAPTRLVREIQHKRGGAGSTGVLRSPTMQTGRASLPPSRRRGPSECSRRTARSGSRDICARKGSTRTFCRPPTAKRRPTTRRRRREKREGFLRPLQAARLGDLDPGEAGRAHRGVRRCEKRSHAVGERRLDGLFPGGRQAEADGSDPSPLASRGRGRGAAGMALRGMLFERRRSRRDAVSSPARGIGRRGGLARSLDARAPPAAAGARRRGAIPAA